MFIDKPPRKRTPKRGNEIEKAPIVEILTHYGAERVPETVRGWAAMRCPFHDDSDASASVNTLEGVFKCHACGMKGDGISLVQQQERQDFPSALETIAGILGRSLQGIHGTTTGRGSGTGIPDSNSRPIRGQTSIFQSRLR